MNHGYYAKVQIQDQTGVWRDRYITRNDPQYVFQAMKSTQSSYPSSRVRAIGFNGQVIDVFTGPVR